MNRRYERLDQICHQFGVAILYAFGGQAKIVQDYVEGRIGKLPSGTSEVDIGVKILPGRKLPIIEKINLSLALEDLFDCDRVPLVFLNEIDPFLVDEIIRGECLFCRYEYGGDKYDPHILGRAKDLTPQKRKPPRY
jgi:hypothetical protein